MSGLFWALNWTTCGVFIYRDSDGPLADHCNKQDWPTWADHSLHFPSVCVYIPFLFLPSDQMMIFFFFLVLDLFVIILIKHKPLLHM